MGGGGQGGSERIIEVFVKIQKKWGGGCRAGVGSGGGGRSGWGGGWGVRVDVNEELNFLEKFKKKNFFFFGGGGPGGGGVEFGGSGWM